MKSRRAVSWMSLVVFGRLLYGTVAHAQGAAPPPPPAPPVSTPYGAYPSALQAPMAVPNGPVVHLTTDKPARLQMMTLKWVDVCHQPCDVPVDPAATYRIGGGTVRPSEPFTMPRPNGEVSINAEVGSTVKHWVGVGMLAGGAGSALTGLLFYSEGPTTTDINGDMNRDAAHGVGIAYIVIGVILAGIGVPLMMSSTSVDVR